MFVPAHIGDYTDFYASIYHATNVGSMFRPDNPLLAMDNVVLTPHIAAGTVDALTEKMQAVFANMQRCLRGEPLHDRIV